ncbi:hypothetical protein V6N12_049390 [Hibiscus sabdariffa]|uniref:Uncharacterized protein n=1 Tax=Hibiscus sabdariffa TaxID=183260 RepID=A0ABR2CB53_9ROSI
MTVFTGWVDNVTLQLNFIVAHKELEPGGSSKVFVNQEGGLETVSSMAHRPEVREVDPNGVVDQNDQCMALDQ